MNIFSDKFRRLCKRPPVIGAAFATLLVLSPIVMGGHSVTPMTG
jgi:hypothetical protein